MSAPTRIDRYLVFDAFARGGSATVHLARSIGPAGFSRVFAIKRLHPDLLAEPEFEAMLIDEARLVSRIRHPNVVPVFEVVSAPGELLLVLEYVPGLALSQLFRLARERHEPVPVPVLVSLMCDILAGLHAAHEAVNESGQPLSVVHRDVSPQNILVGADGTARMVDFGIALATERLQHTRTGELKGKLCYMSPEQVRRRSVDRRTDVFGAGAVLWEGLAGERLFDGEDELAVLRQIADGSYRSPRSVEPAVPEALEAIAMRALSLLPGDRFPTAAAMAVALEAAAPRAAVREVAAWVDHIGGRELASQAELLGRVERYVPAKSGHNVEAPVSVPDSSRARPSRPADATASYTGPVSLPAAREPEPSLDAVVTSEPKATSGDTLVSSVDAPASRGTTARSLDDAALLTDAETIRLRHATNAGQRPGMSSGRFKLVALASSGAALVFLAFMAGALLVRRTSSPPAPTALPSTAPVAARSAPHPAVAPAAPADVREAGVDAGAPEPRNTASRPHRAPGSRTAAKHRPKPPSTPSAATPADCRVPYYLDKDGVKVPKLHCLH